MTTSAAPFAYMQRATDSAATSRDVQDMTNLQLSTGSDASVFAAAKAGTLGSLVTPGMSLARGIGSGTRESSGLFDSPTVSESERDEESDRTRWVAVERTCPRASCVTHTLVAPCVIVLLESARPT